MVSDVPITEVKNITLDTEKDLKRKINGPNNSVINF